MTDTSKIPSGFWITEDEKEILNLYYAKTGGMIINEIIFLNLPLEFPLTQSDHESINEILRSAYEIHEFFGPIIKRFIYYIMPIGKSFYKEIERILFREERVLTNLDQSILIGCLKISDNNFGPVYMHPDCLFKTIDDQYYLFSS